MGGKVFAESKPEDRLAKSKRGLASAENDTRKERERVQIGWWLMSVAAMVTLMIIIGGWTRLTDSGLSITQWRLLSGVIPPLSADRWEELFLLYQNSPEFKLQNYAMQLPEFKIIYWWEWGHRLLGRLTGLVFTLPLIWFAFRRAIPPGWWPRLMLLFTLGASQGAAGWWMVRSGLVEGRTDVESLRLMVHLGLAITLLGLLLHFAASSFRPQWQLFQSRRYRNKVHLLWARWLIGLIFVQILLGALVAGIDAGSAYSDWPLIGGEIWPQEALSLQPFWSNFTENPAMVQFMHRTCAYLVLVASFAFMIKTRKIHHAPTHRWSHYVAGAVFLQLVLGVLVIFLSVPSWLASLHQIGAIVLFALAIILHHVIAYPKMQHINSNSEG